MTRPLHGGNLAWAAATAGCSPSAILDFSASISPWGPPVSAIAAIQSHVPKLGAYPDPDYGQLRAALGQVHNLSADWILPGNGAAELLTWAGWDLSNLAATFLVTPAFGDYRRALRAFDANVVECPLSLVNGQWSLVNGHLSLARDSGLRMLDSGLLLNNPHNPTGQLFFRDDIIPYLEQFALLVVDEAFMDFLPPAEQQSLEAAVADFPNLVILRSLTKFYSLPGLRLGYCIGHPDRLRRWQQWRDPWPVNVLAAAAGTAVVQDTAFQEQTWAWLPRARAELFEGLAKLPGLQPYPSAANFLLVGTEQSSSQLQLSLLRRHRILIRDCLSFPELGDRFFRVAIRSRADNQRLKEGLEDVLS